MVREPIRKDLGYDITSKTIKFNYTNNSIPILVFERPFDRFDRWFRTVRRVKRKLDQSIFGFLLESSVTISDNMFALSTRHFFQQSYLFSIGSWDPQKTIRYDSSIEFYRKRNFRRSFWYRFQILRYINFFFKTRSSIEGFANDLRTRQQQRDLYQARLVFNNYITVYHCYSGTDQTFSGVHQSSYFFNK